MAWVRFIAPFRWKPPARNGNVAIVYDLRTYNVPASCAAEAVAKGRAVRTISPRRPKEEAADVGG